MAEREGFEPSKAFTPYTLSKRARSTTLPPLREMVATHPVLPKAQRRCYRCSLPGLAEFTTCRLQGTKMGHHRVQDAKGIDRQFLYCPGISEGWVPVSPRNCLAVVQDSA